MDRQKTILMTTPYFPPDGGGLENYAFEIARRLYKDFGWRIIIVTSGERRGKDIIEELDGLKVYRLGYSFKFSNTPFSLGWFKRIGEILESENPDIVNIHMPVPGIGDITALLSGKKTIILTYHALSMKKGRAFPDVFIWVYENLFLPMLLRRAEAIVCSSDPVRLNFLSDYLYKSTTINPAVDGKIFKPDENMKAIRPTLLFVAGLGKAEQHKGLQYLFEAVKEIVKKIPDISLVVVGDGDMKSEYERRVIDLNLGKSVVFAGRLSGKRLAEQYQRAHIFVHPTSNDSFSMTILEAMSVGLPVITTNVGGLTELVGDNQEGLIIPQKNSEALALAICRLFDDPLMVEKLGTAGRQKALAKYDWDVQATLYDKICRGVLERKPSIIQVVGYYPPHLGGMEIVAQEVSQALAKRLYPVTVYTSDMGVSNRDCNDNNLAVRYLKSVEIAHTPIMWTLAFRLLFSPKHSIIHIHISQAGIPELVWAISKIRGFKFVSHYHLDVGPSGFFGFLLPFYKKYFLGPVLRASEKVIVFTKEQAEIVSKKYGLSRDKVSIIPNGVDEDFFYRVPRKKIGERLEILYVGRLAVQKRVERLIDMMALLAVPSRLTIVGDGEERQPLETLVREKGLSGKIIFVGKKYGTELRSYYRNADILAISSDQEGMSLVTLEAMASGLPVIGTDVAGIRELIGGVGILVKEPYPENFALELTKLWNNPEDIKRISRLSLEKAEPFSWNKLIARLEDIYENISV